MTTTKMKTMTKERENLFMGKGKKSKVEATEGDTPTVLISNEPQELTRVEGPVVELTLDTLLVDEGKNLRKFPVSAQNIRDLADSIRNQGLINPVIVYPVVGDINGASYNGFTHQLEAGYQRVKALRLLAEEGAPVPIRATVISGSSEGINLDENLKRMDLSPMDLAYILKEKVEGGMGKAASGKLLGLSPASVTRLLALTGLRAEIQTKIHQGQLTARVTSVLPELSETEQDELLADLEKPGESASTKATKAKKKKGRKGKQGRKKAKSSEPGTGELYEAVDGQVGLLEGLEKSTSAEKRALGLYVNLKSFLSGNMSMKALHKKVLALVAPR